MVLRILILARGLASDALAPEISCNIPAGRDASAAKIDSITRAASDAIAPKIDGSEPAGNDDSTAKIDASAEAGGASTQYYDESSEAESEKGGDGHVHDLINELRGGSFFSLPAGPPFWEFDYPIA